MRHPDDEQVLERRRALEEAGYREEHVPIRVYFADLISFLFFMAMGLAFGVALIATAVLFY